MLGGLSVSAAQRYRVLEDENRRLKCLLKSRPRLSLRGRKSHPDKACDYILDIILDAFLHHDPFAHLVCEAAL